MITPETSDMIDEKYTHPILVIKENESGDVDLIPIDYRKKDWVEIVKAKNQTQIAEILISTSEGDMWVRPENILLEN